jgi:signal transduction histidine kinase
MNSIVNHQLQNNIQVSQYEIRAYQGLMHDLGSPYYVIVKSLGNVAATETLSPSARESIDMIWACLEQIDELLQSDIHRVQGRVKLVPVCLQSVVSKVLAKQAVVATSPPRVQVVGSLPTVTGTRSAIYRVVANLLSNAVKFVEPGCRPQVRISAVVLGDRVRLRIADRGIGITTAERECLFKQPQRLHPSRFPGSGCGLTSAWHQITSIGGTLDVTARRGGGSVFWFELPPHPGQPPSEISPPAPSVAG